MPIHQIQTRVPSELVEALDRVAAREVRSRAQQLEVYLRRGLAADGEEVSPPTNGATSEQPSEAA